MAKNQSQARQSSLDFLDSLGTSQKEFNVASGGLYTVCGDFINRVKTNLNSIDHVDSGRSEDSLSVEIIDDLTIQINGSKTILFIDKGIKGAKSQNLAPSSPYQMTKFPNPKIFENWIKSKNIKVEKTSYYLGSEYKNEDKKINIEDDDIKRASYAMALSRYNNGLESNPVFEKEIPLLLSEATKAVANQAVTLLTNFI